MRTLLVPTPFPRPLRAARLLALVVLAAVAVAVAVAQDVDPLVAQPIDPVLDGPIRLSVQGPDRAILTVTSTVDLACVVVYGESDAFGRLALDQDMGGGAHRDHRVLLAGLEPDTEYRYRLQGSGVDGTFYASGVFRFRTPAASEAGPGAELGANLASAARGARVVAVSSGFGDSDLEGRWGGANAIDGDASTEWSSDGDGDGAFLTVELPEPVSIRGVGLWTRTMGSSAQIERFEVAVDGGPVLGPFELPDADGMHAFPAEAEGRRFTFRVVASSGGNTGAVEVALFGPAP